MFITLILRILEFKTKSFNIAFGLFTNECNSVGDYLGRISRIRFIF